MAGVKISQLPVIPIAPALTDIFPEVQPASGGTTYQTTFNQLLSLFQPSIPLANAGNPNGVVAGTTYQLLWDTTDNELWVCTTTGNAASAVWTSAKGFAAPLAVTLGGTGLSSTTINQILYSSAANTIAGLVTANSSVLVTSAGGVPSLSTTLPGGLTTSDPSVSGGIATKNYVDNIATGGGQPVVAATTANLTVTQAGAGVGATLTNAGAQATFSIDGQTPAVGSRVLIKNQSTNTQNGVYTVTNAGSGATNWILTRAIDYDTPTDINDTGLIPVENGTVNGNTAWYNTAVMVVVDTTAVTFVKFGATGTVTSVATGSGLQGGPITSSGTISIANTQTYTPVLSSDGTPPSSVTYSAQLGEYIQLGNLVCFVAQVSLSGFTLGGGTGNVTISLPVTSGGTFGNPPLTLMVNNLTWSSGYLIGQCNGTYFNILSVTPGTPGTASAVTISGVTSTLTIRVSGCYFSA